MRNQWMKRSLLSISILSLMGVAYAQEPVSSAHQASDGGANPSVVAQTQIEAHSTVPLTTVVEQAQQDQHSRVSVPASDEEQQAAEALQKQAGDATQETNLQEVFTANERQYSLIKKGEISTYYDLDYTYYRDTQINAAMDQGVLFQLRVDEDANHTITNTFTGQYGLRDNLTLTASLPLVAKSETMKDRSTAGLGDIGFGARWEPFELKPGRLPLILFGNISTKTGDSPYEINPNTDLSTGKGYYSVGVGASTRKYIDPVVLFASASANYGFKETGLNQIRGGGDGPNRILDSFEPGITGGFSFGYAYSFNYDVSMTMSYQQTFSTNTKFTYTSGEYYQPPNQSSAMFSIALGVRVSPETIVNGTLGIGLTEDSPDVSLGLSFPLDIIGLVKKKPK